MTAYTQLPGTLPLAFRAGDDFSVLVDFSISLDGHSLTATLYSVVSGNSVAAFSPAIVNAAGGQVNLSLTRTQTAAISPGSYRWDLVSQRAGETRSLLNGYVEVSR